MIPSAAELKKGTLGATYEHINKLIKDKELDTNAYINYNENLTVFEKKIQAIIIDTFKLEQGVINCLLSGDPHLVRRMLKCNWFFEGALPPKSFEEEIFPNVSFSTRCKIINQLARNIKCEGDAEELFNFTNKNYGSKYAEMFLPKCSFEFVSDYIINCKPSFNHHDSERILIKICQRFPDIGVSFLENEMRRDGFRGPIYRCSKLVKYLAKHYPLVLLSIFDKFHREIYSFRFGKRSTKALYSEFMRLTEETPISIIMDRINMSVMFKRLSYDEQIIFFKLLVHQSRLGADFLDFKNWPVALSQMKDFLKLTPPNNRARMIETVFFEMYNEQYLDHPELWSLEFTELFPENYRRRVVDVLDKMAGEKAVKDVLRSECRDRDRDPKDTFIYLLGFKNAFPILTEMMSQMTTVPRREILLKEMVRNCIINKDPEGLESVVKYISVRHKNEEPRVIYNLIMYSLMPSPKIINLNVWNWLEKMATLLLVKLNDSYVFQVVLESYMAFKLKNNLDVQPQVKSVVKLSVVPSANSFVLVRNMEKSYSKTLIMLYYTEIFSGDTDYAPDQVKDKLMLSLLMTVNDYNSTMRHNRINMEDLPLLVEGFDRMVKKKGISKDNHSLSAAILNNTFLRNKYASSLLDISMKPKALRYLVKYHPDHITKNFDKILTYILEFSENRDLDEIFVSRCQIDFFGFMPKLEKTFIEKFKSTTVSSVKLKALKTYSHITSLENFTKLTKEYVPEEDRFKFDTNRGDFYEVQISVPGMIRYVKPVWKNFDFVWNYMKKDFLRWVLPSFLAVCYNSSVSSIVPLLKHHFPKKVDVSVKKVILCCILDLSSKVERFEYCQMLWEQEKHSSVREFVFHAISRCCREDQSEEIFGMVKKCIREADEITINGRLKMKMIPPQFVNEYASVLWEFADKYDGQNFAITCKKEIVSHFDAENLPGLSGQFCQRVLKLYLFQSNADVGVEDFCCHYILHHSQPMDQKLTFILDLLRQRRTKYGPITYFLNRLKYFARNDPRPVFVVFEALLEEWPNMYGASKMFREYLFLKYMKGYNMAIQAASSRREFLGAALGEEFRVIINAVPKYECFVEVFKLTLSEFISDFKFHDILEFVIDNFLGSSFGDVEGIIAIHLIPAKALESLRMNVDDPEYNNAQLIELRERYGSIFRKLLDKNDDVLKIYLNIRMNSVLD